ncbi:MAG: PAS domain S-box protein, partial [Planctomycetes bacterium]|nr:PAS domain S-box protein [Planctomycetota bacterium]
MGEGERDRSRRDPSRSPKGRRRAGPPRRKEPDGPRPRGAREGILVDLASLLAPAGDVPVSVEGALARLGPELGLSCAALFWPASGGSILRLLHKWEAGESRCPAGLPACADLSAAPAFADRLAAAAPAVLDDAAALPPPLGALLRGGAAALAVPLPAHGRAAGFALLLRDGPDATFDEEDVRFLSAACRLLAGVLRRDLDLRRLHDSEKRLRAILENTQDAICVLDESGRVVECNATGALLAGMTLDQIVGRRYSEFLDPASLDRLAGTFEALVRTGELRGEFEVRTRGGTLISVDVVIRAFEKGLFLARARDVSTEKRLASKAR